MKSLYNDLPGPLRYLVLLPSLVVLWGPATARDLVIGKTFATWRTNAKGRGMSPWHDLADWIGGYPFEVAKPEEIFGFFHKRGFALQHLMTCGGGHGCNPFLFTLENPVPARGGIQRLPHRPDLQRACGAKRVTD